MRHAGLNESPHPEAGKWLPFSQGTMRHAGLNESPHPKAGKLHGPHRAVDVFAGASMKVPARRQGNAVFKDSADKMHAPQ